MTGSDNQGGRNRQISQAEDSRQRTVKLKLEALTPVTGTGGCPGPGPRACCPNRAMGAGPTQVRPSLDLGNTPFGHDPVTVPFSL